MQRSQVLMSVIAAILVTWVQSRPSHSAEPTVAADQRLEIPAAPDILRAKEFIRDKDLDNFQQDSLFRRDDEATSPSAYLLAAAKATKDDPTLLFARLDESRRLAWEEGHPEIAAAAIHGLAEHFAVDEHVLRTWDGFRLMIDEPVLEDRFAYLLRMNQLFSSIDAAEATGQTDLAREMAEAIKAFAANSKANEIHAVAVTRWRNVIKASEQRLQGFPFPDCWRWKPRVELVSYHQHKGSERAVSAGLHWVGRHQCLDGSWDARFVEDQCGVRTCSQHEDSVGLLEPTAFGLLCYLGAGQTHRSKGLYKGNIQTTVEWIVAAQQEDGSFRANDLREMTAHAAATLALCELWQQTEDEELEEPLERASRTSRSILDSIAES